MLRGASFLLLVVCLSAAPLQQDKALQRTKRDSTDVDPAEAMEKKSSPDEAKTLDKKAEVEVDTAPAENKDVAPDIVEEPPADDSVPAAKEEPSASEDDQAAIDKIFNEDSDGDSTTPEVSDAESEQQAEKAALVEKIMSEDEEPEENLEGTMQPFDNPVYRQYLREYVRKYLPYINSELRRKRSLLKRPVAVTAEQMGQGSGKTNLRRKRDLDVTPEELEYLLEAERDMEPERGYVADDKPAVSTPVEYSPEQENGSDNEALADAELLNYLYKNSPEVAEEAAYNYLPPSDVRESWEDYVPEETDDIKYEPIVYGGQPGIFIPIAQPPQKRQYLSLVPGNRRKRNNFYPSDDSLGGRWGAFIADQQAIKRADAYERLYRLAKALRSDYTDY